MLIENIIRKKLEINKMIVYAYAYNNLQIITRQCVGGYKQKTPRMWGYHNFEYSFKIISYLSNPSPYPFFDI